VDNRQEKTRLRRETREDEIAERDKRRRESGERQEKTRERRETREDETAERDKRRRESGERVTDKERDNLASERIRIT